MMRNFEIISNKKSSLNVQTIYLERGDYIKKKSAETLLVAKPSADVQDAGRSNFNNSIPNSSENVNANNKNNSSGQGKALFIDDAMMKIAFT